MWSWGRWLHSWFWVYEDPASRTGLHIHSNNKQGTRSIFWRRSWYWSASQMLYTWKLYVPTSRITHPSSTTLYMEGPNLRTIKVVSHSVLSIEWGAKSRVSTHKEEVFQVYSIYVRYFCKKELFLQLSLFYNCIRAFAFQPLSLSLQMSLKLKSLREDQSKNNTSSYLFSSMLQDIFCCFISVNSAIARTINSLTQINLHSTQVLN